MASPLNTFKTVTAVISTDESVVYTTPSNVTSIILMAQASNVANSAAEVTFSYFDVSANTATELVKNYEVPSSDASGLITGKLVVETGDSVKALSSANNSIKIVLSVLETVNA